MVVNSVNHGKTKHIEIDIHVVRDKMKDKQLEVRYVRTQYQIADVMTKPLSGDKFIQKSSLMFITGIHP